MVEPQVYMLIFMRALTPLKDPAGEALLLLCHRSEDDVMGNTEKHVTTCYNVRLQHLGNIADFQQTVSQQCVCVCVRVCVCVCVLFICKN